MTLTLSLQTWSWILTAAGALTAWMAASGRQRAWGAGLGCQALWLLYAMSTGQDGFYGSVAIYTAIYLRNLRRGARGPRPGRCCCPEDRCAAATRVPSRGGHAGTARVVRGAAEATIPVRAVRAPVPADTGRTSDRGPSAPRRRW